MNRLIATFQDEEEPFAGPQLGVQVLPDGDYLVGISAHRCPPEVRRLSVRFRVTGSIHPPAAVRAVRDLYHAGIGPEHTEDLSSVVNEALDVLGELLGSNMTQFLRRPAPDEFDASNDHMSKLAYLYMILSRRRLPEVVRQQKGL